jgi:adenosylcobinamide-phosphate synthase
MNWDDINYLLSILTPKMVLIGSLALGYLLDLLLGDPSWFPHPARLVDWLIKGGDRLLNPRYNAGPGSNSSRFSVVGILSLISGALFTGLLSVATWLFFRWFEKYLWGQWPPVYFGINALMVYLGLANRQSVREGLRVFNALNDRGLANARHRLSRLVVMDTGSLGSRQIRIAVLESLAGDLNDGSIAPLFYFALAGIPGMMTYKIINALDSTIGYHTERHEQFGKMAARLDDLVNLVPARLTALLMVLVSASFRGLVYTIRFGHRHNSPNAGYPEAALAGILNVRFGGPNFFRGVLVERPYIGTNERDIRREEIYRVGAINHLTCLLMVVLVILLFISTSIYPL